MSAKVVRGFKFFPFGHTLGVSHEADLQTGELSRIVEGLTRDIVAPMVGSAEILNLKGSDLPNADLGNKPEFSPTKDELLFVGGRCFSDNHEEIHPKKEFGKSAFTFVLTTEFVDFPDSGGIRYAVREKRSQNLSEAVTLIDIGRAFPLEIDYVRFGLEFFKMKSSLFGLIPDTNESITLEASASKLIFNYEAQALKSKTSWPNGSLGMLRQFAGLLGFTIPAEEARSQ